MNEEDRAQAPVYSLDDVRPEDAWLKVEYQTITRVAVQADDPLGPLEDEWVLFTIHTYAESLEKVVARAPNATAVLARALRHLDARQQK